MYIPIRYKLNGFKTINYFYGRIFLHGVHRLYVKCVGQNQNAIDPRNYIFIKDISGYISKTILNHLRAK